MPSPEPRSFDPPAFIDLEDERQVEHWTRALQATPEELRQAVRKVGPHHTAVEIYLALPPDEAPSPETRQGA